MNEAWRPNKITTLYLDTKERNWVILCREWPHQASRWHLYGNKDQLEADWAGGFIKIDFWVSFIRNWNIGWTYFSGLLLGVKPHWVNDLSSCRWFVEHSDIPQHDGIWVETCWNGRNSQARFEGAHWISIQPQERQVGAIVCLATSVCH